ncbi:hypothetical protein R6Z07F_010072 [Ovis aries]
MPRNGIFPRDVKPEDILIKQDVLKLGDLRSCRSVYSKQPYMEHLSTCRYRAPECLLTHGFYSYTMDLWTAGCELYKMASLQPLFPRANELVQISRIHDVMGTPAEKTLAKSRGLLRSKLWPGTGESPPAVFSKRPHGTRTTQQHLADGTGGPEAETAPPRPEEDQPRRQGPGYLMELPRRQLSGAAKLSSYSSQALQSVFARRCHC